MPVQRLWRRISVVAAVCAVPCYRAESSRSGRHHDCALETPARARVRHHQRRIRTNHGAAPDGYTLLFAYTGHVINPALFKKLLFDPLRDFSPVGMIAINHSALVVNPSLPAQSVKELISLAKARPGKLSIAALPGTG